MEYDTVEYDPVEQHDLDDPDCGARSRLSHTTAAAKTSHHRILSTSTNTNTIAALTTAMATVSTAGSSSGDAMGAEQEDSNEDQEDWISLSRSSGFSISSSKHRIPKSYHQGLSSPAGMPKPVPRPVLHTAVPADDLALRHPTPVDDQQVRQASYTGKIQHLERTAEQLSMTSTSSTSLQDAIRELHGELKRNDNYRSPLQTSSSGPTIERREDSAPLREATAPQDSHAPDSLARSASKSSRFGSRREPEREGRPLDAYVKTSQAATTTAEEGDHLLTMTPPPVDLQEAHKLQVRNPEPQHGEDDEPATPALTDTFDIEKAFAGFDGAHGAPPPTTIPSAHPIDELDIAQRRASTSALLTRNGMGASTQTATNDRLSVPGNAMKHRMSRARSQTYDDPQTGQQMVYYPAPVPVMLNLPQRLSRQPSSMARTKRRSEALGAIPPAARQTAIWLPDVLEIENEPNLPETDEAQRLEYVPQHQRMSMGGRRVAQDIQHLPPQLRASALFDQPLPGQVVELKGQSAVATLDSILDASAHAPVAAFTDHVFAGPLGPEVYGKAKAQNRGSTANLLSPEEKAPKKRSSAFNLLGRRASSGNLLETDTEKRRAMIADIRAGKIIREDDEEEDNVVSDNQEEAEEDQDYHGAPTTLLAELQLRKQQQKHRTRPLTTAYPNGLHSTLLELDAVAQVEANTRKQKRVTLAWEDPSAEEAEDPHENDDDVPLAYLYAKKAQALDLNRPPGLLERRIMEDTEPLSRRRDRLQGKVPKLNRTSALNLNQSPPEEAGETLAQRLSQLNGDGEAATDLPKARPVSGDFASEMMSQFGGDLLDTETKGKESPANEEEEETLGQRRKRLQAEAQARAAEVGPPRDTPSRPELHKRHSMADILQHHPQASAYRMNYQAKSSVGLLGMQERGVPQSSGMLEVTSRAPVGGFKGGIYNDGQAGAAPRHRQAAPSPYNMAAMHQFPQPSLGFAGGFSAPYYNPGAMPMAYLPQMHNTMADMQNTMAGMLQMGVQPLNQGQIDMVERWRQSIMQ